MQAPSALVVCTKQLGGAWEWCSCVYWVTYIYNFVEWFIRLWSGVDVVLPLVGSNLPMPSLILSSKGQRKVPRGTVTVSNDERSRPVWHWKMHIMHGWMKSIVFGFPDQATSIVCTHSLICCIVLTLRSHSASCMPRFCSLWLPSVSERV